MPVDTTLINDCTEEAVQLTGDVNFLFHVTEDANGGLHVQLHTSAQGITGTGLESGTQYRVVGVTRDEYYFGPGETREETYVNSVRLVSNGSSDNLLVTQIFHVTFNANGEPTVELVREDIQCAG